MCGITAVFRSESMMCCIENHITGQYTTYLSRRKINYAQFVYTIAEREGGEKRSEILSIIEIGNLAREKERCLFFFF